MINEAAVENAREFLKYTILRLDDQTYHCSTILRAREESESCMTFELDSHLSLWVVGKGFEIREDGINHGVLVAYLFDCRGRGRTPHIEISPDSVHITYLGESGKEGMPLTFSHIRGQNEEYLFQQSTIQDMFSVDESFCSLLDTAHTKLCAIHVKNVLKEKESLTWAYNRL